MANLLDTETGIKLPDFSFSLDFLLSIPNKFSSTIYLISLPCRGASCTPQLFCVEHITNVRTIYIAFNFSVSSGKFLDVPIVLLAHLFGLIICAGDSQPSKNLRLFACPMRVYHQGSVLTELNHHMVLLETACLINLLNING